MQDLDSRPSIGTGFFEIRLDEVVKPNLPTVAKKPVEEKLENKQRQPSGQNEIATLLMNANLLCRHGEKTLALGLIRQGLYLNSYHAEALKALARSAPAKDIALQEKALQALQKSESNFETLSDLAHCYYQQQKDTEALRFYREALSVMTEENLSHPEKLFAVYKNMGNLLCREGDFDGAEESYCKAFALNSKSDTLQINLGTLAVQRQNLEEALERFRSALQINAKNDKAWVGLAMVHNTMGDFVLAKANIEKAIDINPGNRTAVHLFANWCVRDQQVGRAIEVLTDYLGRADHDEELSLVLIHLFCLQSRWMEALFEVERALLWNPENQQILKIESEIRNASKRDAAA
jgi:tetratricopeptide (TPR) repeat protein